jgi:metal-responsive CopG/Arc/MetJ family transcriptional regulator
MLLLKGLLEAIDVYARNIGKTRSAFLADAARSALHMGGSIQL